MLKPKVSLPKTSATFSPRLAVCSNSERQIARGLQRRGDFAAAAGQGAGDGGVGKGFVQCGDDFGVVQYVRRAGSEDETFFRQCKTLHVIGIKTGGFSVIGVAIRLGVTMVSLCRPIVFIARAAEPMLAGWLVRVRMMRMLPR